MTQLEEALLFNRAVQGYDPLTEVEAWFNGQGALKRRDALLLLWQMAQQAGWRVDATHDDTATALERATATGSVVADILAGLPRDAMAEEIARSPSDVQGQVFRVLLYILQIADDRRRLTICRSGCSHWWHEDLNDPTLLDRVRKLSADRQKAIDDWRGSRGSD
jgi:Family of unknown function (DUF5958)